MTRETFATPTPTDPVPPAAFPFSKEQKILRSSDFRRIYQEGVRLTSPYFAAFCRREAGQAKARFGFTTPRALGKAVKRNRIKRRMREVVRLEAWRLEPHWQVVFNPRRQVLDAPFDALRREVEKLFLRCGNL